MFSLSRAYSCEATVNGWTDSRYVFVFSKAREARREVAVSRSHRIKFVVRKKLSVERGYGIILRGFVQRLHDRRPATSPNFTRLSLLTSSPFQRDHSVEACVPFIWPQIFVQRSSFGLRSRHRRPRANLKIEAVRVLWNWRFHCAHQDEAEKKKKGSKRD